MIQSNSCESEMDVNVNISDVEVYYGDYTFYMWHIRKKKGALIALPFFTYENEVQKFEGYLIYHDKESYGYSKEELHKFGIETIIKPSASGMAGGLSPLPYKTISEEKIETALEELIQKNTRVELGGDLCI